MHTDRTHPPASRHASCHMYESISTPPRGALAAVLKVWRARSISRGDGDASLLPSLAVDHSWCRGFSYCALDADELWDFAWHNVDHFAACGCKKLYATSSSSRAVNDTSSTATPAFASATTTSTTSSTTDSVSASATTPASSYPTRRDLESPPKLRYLPLGVLTPSPTAHHARKPPPLTFFGLMDKRNSSDTRAPKVLA